MVNNKVESETNTQKIKDFLDLYEKKDMSKIDQKIFKGIIERKVSEEDAFSGSDDSPTKKSIIHKNKIIQDINVFNNDEQIQPMSFEPANESKDELTSRVNVDNQVPNEYDDFKLPEIANKCKQILFSLKIIIKVEFS